MSQGISFESSWLLRQLKEEKKKRKKKGKDKSV